MTESAASPSRGGGRFRHATYPIYPAFASFAAVCFILTLLSDLAYWATDSFLWNSTSVWLLTIGLGVGALAGLAGIVDLVRSRQFSGLGPPWPTILGQIVAFCLSVVNVFVHSRDGYTAIVPQGLALSCLVVLVLFLATIFGRARVARAPFRGLA